jgi:hypothetical protein
VTKSAVIVEAYVRQQRRLREERAARGAWAAYRAELRPPKPENPYQGASGMAPRARTSYGEHL